VVSVTKLKYVRCPSFFPVSPLSHPGASPPLGTENACGSSVSVIPYAMAQIRAKSR
jgi:hypothetical protein